MARLPSEVGDGAEAPALLKDVAAAGGWNDVDTLLKVYQQPDLATRLLVMSDPRKVSDSISAAQ